MQRRASEFAGWLFPAVVLCFYPCRAALAAEQVAWKNAAEVRQELQGTIRITWPSNPLRDSLANLAKNRRVSIWLDRRIDPDQRVDFKTDDVAFSAALSQLADRLGGKVGLIGSVVYIGPKPAVANLQALFAKRRDEAAKLPADARRKFTHVKTWQWEELSEPRVLLEELAAEGGFNIEGLDQVPHDLWPAGDWPALSLSDRLSLVLAGFDLTYEFSADGGSLKLVPYPKTAAAADEPATVSKQPPKRPPPVGGDKRFSLTVPADKKQPVGRYVKALADQLSLQVKFDESLTAEQLNQPISFQVKDVTLDALFAAVLKPAGLAHKITGQTVEVFAK
jgi:hypothetical protein